MENESKRITLYTGLNGKKLSELSHSFCASDVKIANDDLEFTIDKKHVLSRFFSSGRTMYDIYCYADSIIWKDEEEEG